MPSRPRNKLLHALVAFACLVGATVAAPGAAAQTPGSGGATFTPPPPPAKAALVDGRVIAPASAPARQARDRGRQPDRRSLHLRRRHKLYVRGALDAGYDCSGAVSYALYGGRFLRSPLPSGALMDWGQEGTGRWITVYANGGHAYVVVAGFRFDTSMRDPDAPGPSTGPRWSKTLRTSSSFVAHPRGY